MSERPDPADIDGWYRAIPGLGRWVTEESERALFDELGPELFARECLCSWDPDPTAEGSGGAFDPAAWALLADAAAPQGASPRFAVATAPDRSWSALGAAWRRPDGLVQVSLVDYRPGTAWIAEKVAANAGRAVVDTASRGLVPNAAEPSQAEQARAHNALSDAVLAGTIRHDDLSALNMAVRSSRWKPLGDTRVLDRKGSTDISPLIAVALAAHAVSTAESVYESRGALIF